MLKLLMVGAGGIGGYYAARFLEAGHQVVLTARGAHLHALKRSGLTVHYEGRELVHMAAAHDHQELVTRYKSDEFDLIIITLKATATVSVVSELGDWLKQGRAPVLSLQNGVDNEPLLAKAVGAERVIGGLAVRIGGHIVRPGVIEAEGLAQIVMGEWPKVSGRQDSRTPLLKILVAAFNDAGIPTRYSDNINY